MDKGVFPGMGFGGMDAYIAPKQANKAIYTHL